MRRPILYVIAIIIFGLMFAGGFRYAIQVATSDARGNQLPYIRETVEFPDAGPEQFIDSSPEPKYKAEREDALGIKSSP